MGYTIDTSTDHGQRAARRLVDEQIGWFTTTSRDGTPQPNPVWFIWEAGTILIYCEPTAVKVQHLARDPRASFHLEAGPTGEDVVVLTGRAEVDASAVPVGQHAVYLEKYREGIIRYIGSPEKYNDTFMTAIRFHPERLRGF